MRRRLVLLAMFAVAFACAMADARAQVIEVRNARLHAMVEGLALDADFSMDLGPRLSEVVTNGVPLYFVIEFELTRPRWYWFDEQTATKRMQVRLSYHALSRQYRLSTGPLQQNFRTLTEATRTLSHLRDWVVVDRTVSLADADYQAAVRMRLDLTLLPKPFQLSALTDRDLHLESAWYRFTVHSPRQLPAPVESREPQPAEGSR